MPPTIYRPYIWPYMAIYTAIYGQCCIFVWPYFGKLEAMTGNSIATNGHILDEIDLKWLYFPEMAPWGSEISVDVFNSKASDLSIVSAIRKSLTSQYDGPRREVVAMQWSGDMAKSIFFIN